MNIIYTKNDVSITMPQSRPYDVGGTVEAKEIVLAGGKKVYEMKGFRVSFTASWDWVPQKTIIELVDMLRYSKVINVTYYDPKDGIITAPFTLTFPTLKTWIYENGVPRWHDFSIVHQAQMLRRKI